MKKIARRLKRLRDKKKLSQQEIAKRLGVEQSTVSRWESGAATPAGLYLAALLKMLAEAES